MVCKALWTTLSSWALFFVPATCLAQIPTNDDDWHKSNPRKVIPTPSVAQAAHPSDHSVPIVWDANKSLESIQKRAVDLNTYRNLAEKEKGHCAHVTTDAIDDGFSGRLKIDRVNLAKDFGPSLVRAGFRKYSQKDIIEFKKGDVAVIEGYEGAPKGHMAMYDGKEWISDFKQTGPHSDLPYPGPGYRKAQPSYKIYRYETTGPSKPIATQQDSKWIGPTPSNATKSRADESKKISPPPPGSAGKPVVGGVKMPLDLDPNSGHRETGTTDPKNQILKDPPPPVKDK
jgi:hypothetical protein